MKAEASGIILHLNEETLHLDIKAGAADWKWADGFCPAVITEKETIPFSRWQEIGHEKFVSGVGKGIRSSYRMLDGEEESYSFETSVWVEEMEEDWCAGSGKGGKLYGRVHFEWIPICEEGLAVKEVRWPGCMEFEEPSPQWQTLVNEGQGLLIPNNWKIQAARLPLTEGFSQPAATCPGMDRSKMEPDT